VCAREVKFDLIRVKTSISDSILQKLVFRSFLDSFMRQDSFLEIEVQQSRSSFLEIIEVEIIFVLFYIYEVELNMNV